MRFMSDVLAIWGQLMILLMLVVVAVLMASAAGLSRNHLISYGWDRIPTADPWKPMPTTDDDSEYWDKYSWVATADMDSDPVTPLPKPDNN